MTCAIGVTTMNRPAYLDKCLRALEANVRPLGCPVAVYNDGSDTKYRGEYNRAYRRVENLTVFAPAENQGVAYAKNRLLEWMLGETDATYLFLLEDDILLRSPKAVTEYVRVAKAAALHHLSFAHHGPANVGGPVATNGDVEFYPHSIGAWTMFTRKCLLDVGLMDENFHNAWEHVEHELRVIRAGYLPGADAMRYPDVAGSAEWLTEIPGSIDRSSIRPRGDWHDNIRNGLLYWRDNKPETYGMLFGPGTPLENYALSITG